jgi:hypothetical protein
LCPAQEKGIIVFAVDGEGTPGAERSIGQLQIKRYSKRQEYLPQKSTRDANRNVMLCAFCASLRPVDFEYSRRCVFVAAIVPAWPG